MVRNFRLFVSIVAIAAVIEANGFDGFHFIAVAALMLALSGNDDQAR